MPRLYLLLFGFIVSIITSANSSANEDGDCHGPHCQVPITFAKFSLDCLYENPAAPAQIQHCEVKSKFHKSVTLEGGEVADSSPTGSPVHFTLQCDGIPLTSFSGVRFTNLLTTRIESVSPTSQFPAFNLPRGSLHTGNHTSTSTLEILFGLTLYRLEGRCYIKTI